MQPVLQLSGITKSFEGVTVLRKVDFDVRPGEVHALVGENGAGKSTLMKIAAGVHQADSGRIVLRGEERSWHGPADALKAGVAMVHQELSLAPDVSVAENIFAGREPMRGPFMDWKRLFERASMLLADFGVRTDPSMPVSALGLGHRQVIEILKALASEPCVVIFDEPTSSLEAHETALVLDTIRRLSERLIGVVYISHRMDEVFEVSDRITVLRDGERVCTQERRDVSRTQIVNSMVGREMAELYPPRTGGVGRTLMRVRGLSRNGAFRNVSFELRQGEILGFSGLVGSGRTELMRAIFGADPVGSGDVELEGRVVRPRSVGDVINAGIAYLPEERKTLGLFLDRSVQENIVAANLEQCSRAGVMSSSLERGLADSLSRRLGVRARDLSQTVGTLSGGNQQKVLLAKWIARNPKVIIADEPTRGVDVGAKGEIHRMLREYADAGNGVIVVSSEMPEIIGLCDRIIVMHDGRIAGEVPGAGATEEQLIGLAVGHG